MHHMVLSQFNIQSDFEFFNVFGVFLEFLEFWEFFQLDEKAPLT